MTPREFYDAVVEMRRLQKLYFDPATRSKEVLRRSKAQEKIIDNEIKRVNELLTRPRLQFSN